jgi:isoleucyl-tRNA synthetase
MSKMHGRENDTVKVVESVEKSEAAKREESVQVFWVEHDIFNRSLEAPAGSAPVGDFVFYDGPPFATGLPHYGHILAGTIKDAVPRFWTMNGYRVRRQWGWDCHGLPVENLIEKKLGLATKKDIEEHGIKEFNESARESVMEYADDWAKIVPRMGRFVDMENDYKSMDSTYTESVWWVFKSLHDKGLVYEGFKSMHLCPRCGTTLSNFEVNQGYKDIKDLSVFVELPLVDEDASLLVWTTTPWTLPGNMAAAVNNEFEYATVEVTTEGGAKKVVLAKDRVEAVLMGKEYKILETRKGSELVGKKYTPPFDYLVRQDLEGKENGWTIYHADYVEIGEEGTGAVHIAPAYGDDDMKLGQEHNFPIKHHVDEGGHFMDFVTDFAGQLVKPKDDSDADINHMDTDIEIIRALAAKGILFGKEKITHSYPHCWRCDTPLLNYATTSWFVEVTKIKDDLVAANEKVTWVPGHVGKNRFGKWLAGARDWAVSRQRYWGAPLPIWRNPETKEYKVIGSLADLQEHVPKSGNHYFTVRHGESESNLASVVSSNKETKDGLTKKGQEQVQAVAEGLKDVDIIIHSGLQRTRETAEIIAKVATNAEVIEDERIRELDLSDTLEGKPWSDYNSQFPTWNDRFTTRLEESENRRDVQVRMGAFINDIDKKYKNKKILLVSHNGTLFALECASQGLNASQAEAYFSDGAIYHQNAEVRELAFTRMPHNENYELDFHRPYIDEIELYEGDTKLERVPDVFDCWFESGSMPYAQHHYPFECPEFTDKNFPANFIAEGLDQTRGWFYSLIVLGVALFGKSPFENVVVNGTVLAEDGSKMSKSLQNYPDPMDLADRTGIDSMRFYLLSSPGIKGEDFSFSEKEVLEIQRKNIGRLHNVLAMYEMYKDDTPASSKSENVLDKWIISRLNQVITETTIGYKNYELDKATRPITDLIDDLSVWYLRRSRDRLKGEEKKDVLRTLRLVFQELSLVMAPSMPFYAEYLWQAVKEEEDAESVHLAKWPEAGKIDETLLESMEETRNLVTAALEARVKCGIKVRQPIASVSGPKIPAALAEVVLDELNAKAYLIVDGPIAIDTTLTPELIAEGAVRELMRAVQGKRKQMNLEPQDVITLKVDTNDNGQEAISNFNELLVNTVGAKAVEFCAVQGEEIVSGNYRFKFEVNLG